MGFGVCHFGFVYILDFDLDFDLVASRMGTTFQASERPNN